MHALGLACLVGSAPAQALKNVSEFELKFRPTQVVGTPDSRFDASAFDSPFRREQTDRRGPARSDRIGTRTDDDDRRFELRATNDALGWTYDAVRRILAGWGGAPGAAMDPESLRRERPRLRRSAVGDSVVSAYLNSRRLTRPLNVDDILTWKESGIPESMIDRALGLPVDDQNPGVRE